MNGFSQFKKGILSLLMVEMNMMTNPVNIGMLYPILLKNIWRTFEEHLKNIMKNIMKKDTI